jgi:hypothetical protein
VRIAKGKANFQNPEEFLICQGKIVRNRKVKDQKKPCRITNTFRWKDWSAYQKKKQEIPLRKWIEIRDQQFLISSISQAGG